MLQKTVLTRDKELLAKFLDLFHLQIVLAEVNFLSIYKSLKYLFGT
jgi:hypothetical protein